MIAARDGEAVAVHRARNAAASPLRYEIDGMEQYKIQTAIEDAGLELGAIYHSHTRSAPDAVADRHQPRLLSRGAVRDRRRQGRRARRAGVAIVDGQVSRGASSRSRTGLTRSSAPPARRGTTTASGSARAAALPLVHADGAPAPRRVRARASARARSARSTPRARSCGSPARATRPRPSCSRGCCSRRACPSLMRRSGGFDVPDFLAAGPRDILVPASGAERRARDPRRRPSRPPCAERAAGEGTPPWVRALAAALAVLDRRARRRRACSPRSSAQPRAGGRQRPCGAGVRRRTAGRLLPAVVGGGRRLGPCEDPNTEPTEPP